MHLEQGRVVGDLAPERQPDVEAFAVEELPGKHRVDDSDEPRLGCCGHAGLLDDRQHLAIHGVINRGEQAIDGFEMMGDEAARNLGLGADAVDGEAQDAVLRQTGDASFDKHLAAGFGGLAGEFGLGRGFLVFLGHGGVGGAIHDNAAPWLYFLEHGRVGMAVRQDDGLQIVIVNGNVGLKADENEAA